MGDRKSTRRRKKHSDDADASLRHLSRRYPDGLARRALGQGQELKQVEPMETQVVSRQRRVDRALRVTTTSDDAWILHWEWTLRLDRKVCKRVFEYHVLLALGAEMDAEAKRDQGERGVEALRVESVVVVLTGRRKPWPTHGFFRTSRQGKQFSGVRFRIEAVYQRTVAELEAMGSVFWLVFVPLAMDVDEEKLRRVLRTLQIAALPEDFADLVATMVALAEVKKDAPNLPDMIRSLLPKEVGMRHPWFRDGRALGRKEGLEKGLTKGREQGREQGREEGREEGLEPLLYVLECRLGRALTAIEQRRVASRLVKDGPRELGKAVDLSRAELEAWLAPRKVKANKRAA